jgi:hypothetical protein
VFYETLFHQKPESEMAQEWCVLYGILDYDTAYSVYEQICKRKGKSMELSLSQQSAGKNRSPQKSSRPSSQSTAVTTTSVKPGATASRKRKVIIEDEIEGDLGLGQSSNWEGVGTIGI